MRTDLLHIRRVLCAASVAAMFAAGPVSAQQDFGGPTDPKLDVQNFEPTPSPYGIFNVDASQTSADLQVSGGLVLHYDKDPLVLVPAGSTEEIAIIENQVVAEALFALGLFDFLELGISFPIYLLNSASIDQTTIEGATVGDLHLRPKVTAISSQDNPVGLAFVLNLTFPTGDTKAFTSSGNVAARPGVVIDTKIDRLLLALNLGAELQSARTFGNLEVGSELVLGAGAQYEVVENRFLLAAEVYGSTTFDDFFKSEETPLEGLVGIKYRTDFGLNLETGIGRGIIAGYGAPEIRIFGGLRYAEYDPDWDRDGILNAADQCPRVAEDKDQFEDEDGCPDPDNDQDQILDVDDSCPNEPEDRDEFEDEDGCPDPDNDKDGTLDVDDACPLVPGPKQNKGCPVMDRDGDRIPDDVDKCPDDPEDYDTFEDEDGCPDPDNDKDGILDVTDQCPLDPEDKDGFEDQDGCPDPDNDGDGILDVDDKCPNQPETFNQFEDEDGCPDKNIIVEKGEIKILERVYFETNSTKVAARSRQLLRDVATVLENYPGIKRVEIQGHTDDRASDAYNLTLSEGRAESVYDFLTKECGVDAKRLRPKGYGETVPAEAIEGKSGRALARARDKNRRVQFIILEQVEEQRGKVKTK